MSFRIGNTAMEMDEEDIHDYVEYWSRGKQFLHLDCIRAAIACLTWPDPYTGKPTIPPLEDGRPDLETAYRCAIADLGLERHN